MSVGRSRGGAKGLPQLREHRDVQQEQLGAHGHSRTGKLHNKGILLLQPPSCPSHPKQPPEQTPSAVRSDWGYLFPKSGKLSTQKPWEPPAPSRAPSGAPHLPLAACQVVTVGILSPKSL